MSLLCPYHVCNVQVPCTFIIICAQVYLIHDTCTSTFISWSCVHGCTLYMKYLYTLIMCAQVYLVHSGKIGEIFYHANSLRIWRPLPHWRKFTPPNLIFLQYKGKGGTLHRRLYSHPRPGSKWGQAVKAEFWSWSSGQGRNWGQLRNDQRPFRRSIGMVNARWSRPDFWRGQGVKHEIW